VEESKSRKKFTRSGEKENMGLFIQNTNIRPSVEPGRRQVFMEKASTGNETEESKIDESKFDLGRKEAMAVYLS
jgi:hypothetical protein